MFLSYSQSKGTITKAGVSGNVSFWHVFGSYGLWNHPIATKLGTDLPYNLRDNISILIRDNKQSKGYRVKKDARARPRFWLVKNTAQCIFLHENATCADFGPELAKHTSNSTQKTQFVGPNRK